MDWGSVIEDIGFLFGGGGGAVSRTWDVIAALGLVLLGMWFGFERWGRRSAVPGEVPRKLRRTEPVVPAVTVAVAGPEPGWSGDRRMEDTAPVSLRVLPGSGAAGWEGPEPVELRPQDLGALAPERRREIAEAARREVVCREEAERAAEARRGERSEELARWNDALEEARAKVEIGTVPVSEAEIRGLERGRDEAKERWETACREVRQAREETEVARLFAEVAEAAAHRG
jgi:hypothetical protein